MVERKEEGGREVHRVVGRERGEAGNGAREKWRDGETERVEEEGGEGSERYNGRRKRKSGGRASRSERNE
jgi:hypothetical protein